MKMLDEDARWAAKYPFDKESINFLRKISLPLQEYILEYKDVIENAYKRVLNSLEGKIISDWDNDYIEGVSFYIASLIIAGTKNYYLYKKFADTEAKRVYKILRKEDIHNILKLAKNLEIDIKRDDNVFKINYKDFIKLTRKLSSLHWRLYNFYLNNGYVEITQKRLSRLIAEFAKEKIFNIITNTRAVPPELEKYSNEILSKFDINVKTLDQEIEVSKDKKMYPPCIEYLIKNIREGLSHPGRFTLVTFLHRMGYSIEEIVNLFKVTPDFNERMTRYQVEHIIGIRGSRIEYQIPSCKKIRSYGYCIPDEICRKHSVKHPLRYVTIKKRLYK